jgi:hypothetical protein
VSKQFKKYLTLHVDNSKQQIWRTCDFPYEVIYVIKTVMKYHLKKIDTSVHQPLPNMVQRLFADAINDVIWFMNIHEQNHP